VNNLNVVNDKIKMEKITVLWAEGLSETNVVFNSFAEVNKMFKDVAQEIEGDFYNKAKVVIEFEDGNTYTSEPAIDKNNYNLQNHIINYLEYHTSCPEWESRQKWNKYMCKVGWDILEKCEVIFETYLFEDTEQESTQKEAIQLLNTTKHLLENYTASDVLVELINSGIDSLRAYQLINQAIMQS
jgi:hypothetical protein